MLQKNPPPLLSAANVADFLADREGLAGVARTRFRRVLQEYGSFQEKKDRTNSAVPIAISAVLALAGGLLNPLSGWDEGLALSIYILLSTGLLFFRHRHGNENKPRQPDHETDWEAYCLFLRPIILNDHPGLLDRNKGEGVRPHPPPTLPPATTLQSLFRERSAALWWSAMTGLWISMALLLALHSQSTAVVAGAILPTAILVGGMLLGVLSCVSIQRVVYLLVKWHIRRLGS